jgi:P-type conjugative transfer protein TrbJ
MNPRRSLVTLTAAIAMSMAAAPAYAQFGIGGIVYDPSNYAQNVLTAARTLQQINNQITSLQNEAQMLLNGAKNLTGLDFTALNELRANLARTRALIDQAQGLAFDVSSLDKDFRRLYPDAIAPGTTGANLASQARDRWTASLESLRTAMQVQAEVSGAIREDEATLAAIAGRSSSAVGMLQAVQATNELLALQAKQAMQTQQLQLAQGRSAASEAARAVAAEERARAVRSRFRGTNAYTPVPVQAFGGKP